LRSRRSKSGKREEGRGKREEGRGKREEGEAEVIVSGQLLLLLPITPAGLVLRYSPEPAIALPSSLFPLPALALAPIYLPI
jgi:hypothetical protein